MVTVADSGLAALEIAAAGTFDLAILDIAMPGMSGIDVGRELRARHGVPCLFLSAHDDVELVAQVVEEGGISYLVKPLSVAQLAPAIELALARANDMRNMIGTMAHLEHALAGSRSISVAVGILMERLGLDQQAAFEMLRNQARTKRCRLEDRCSELIGSQRPPVGAGSSS